MTEIELKKNAYVLDTSVFIHDPNCVERFGSSFIVVPLKVVEELDDLKDRGGTRASYARQASRVLESFRLKGDFRKLGVPTEQGGKLFIAYGAESWDALDGLGKGLSKKNDNLILLVAKNWQKHNPDHNVIIVTLDTNMRIKAAALDMEAQDYSHADSSESNNLYTGHSVLELEDQGLFQKISSDLNMKGAIDINVLTDHLDLDSIGPNHCLTIKCMEKYSLVLVKKEKSEIIHVQKPSKGKRLKGAVKPRNDTQAFAYHMAADPHISLLTLLGKAGAGKTLIALLAAFEQLGRQYKRILVYRPIHEVGGKELGFLPGDMNKKFGPWARPILDNLELIFEYGNSTEYIVTDEVVLGDDNIDIATENGHILISPIIYIRGRSLHDSYVIVDEAQNLTPNDIKSLITRAGKGTKVVITGDPSQIDNRYLDSSSNGLVLAIKNFSKKGWGKFAHINMEKSERSELADIAAEIL